MLMAMCLTSACVKTGDTKTGTAANASLDADGLPHVGVTQTDYDGFKYLYKERFITPRDRQMGPETGGEVVILYVPDSDYISLGRSDVMSDRLGVTFEASLNPDGRLNDDYTLEEMLDQYMQQYDTEDSYTYYDRQQVEIEKPTVSEDGKRAVSRVTYFEEDYFGKYQYMEDTVALYQMDDGTLVRVSVMVNTGETKSKTSELINEINTFYGEIVQWDAEAAKKKLEEFVALNADNGQAAPEDGRFHTKYMSFELPDGWEETYSDYMGAYIYTLENMYSWDHMLMLDIADTNLDSSDVEEAISQETITETVVKELLDIEDEEFTYTYAEGSLGKAVCVTLAQQSEDMDEAVNAYITVGADRAIYKMIAYSVTDGDSEDMAKEALDMMFQTAELEEAE